MQNNIRLEKHSEFCKCESCSKPILKWTKELPIKEGYYWFKNEVGAEEIVNFKNGGFESYGIDGCLSANELPNGEWYGPLEAPK